ncbi:MAG: nicotinamide-nucleotide adenylyltransferase [Candidatus Hodarchaeales archaeon]
MQNNSRSLFVGRFNPFHFGHLKAVKKILTEQREIVIAIGSTQESHTIKNPFTAGERIMMIHSALIEANIQLSNVFVTVVPDINRYSVWVSHLQSYCPFFDIVYTNNSLIKQLFIESGIKVKSIGFFNRSKYNGTYIRNLMLKGDEWKSFLPPAVVNVIESINGITRIRSVYNELNK